MRMWGVSPKLLCNQHLLGEHREMHAFLGTLKKGISIAGYLRNGLIEVHNLSRRHDELSKEMTKRGMRHKTPMRKLNLAKLGYVDKKASLVELRNRCKNCRLKQTYT